VRVQTVKAITVFFAPAGRNVGRPLASRPLVKLMHAFPDPSAADYEHVCLASEEAEEPAPGFPAGAVVAELEQSAGGLARQLTIFERNRLGVRIRRPSGRLEQYWLNLAFLDPRPVRAASREWWVAGGLLAGIGLVQLLLARYSLVSWSLEWLAVACALLASGAFALAVAARRRFGRLVFRTRHGRVPILELAHGASDRRRLAGFVALLQASIRAAANRRETGRTELLRNEMHEHRRLLEAGVLQAGEFEQARARILRAHG
jgi:hypothetical protein